MMSYLDPIALVLNSLGIMNKRKKIEKVIANILIILMEKHHLLTC